jgi:hypothetical protein
MLYSFAFILDPRGKLKGFSRVLRLVGKLIGVDYSSYLTEVRAQLNIILKRYDDKFGAAKRKACPQAPTVDKKNSAWDDIFADDEDEDVDMFGTPGSGNSFCTPTLTMSRRTSACMQHALVLLLLLDLLWVLVMSYLATWTVIMSLTLMISSTSLAGGMSTNFLILSFQY